MLFLPAMDVFSPNRMIAAGSIDSLVQHSGPREGHRVFNENQKGVTFGDLFWPWIAGAKKVVITDPFIRMFHQIRNLMEFVEMIALRKAPEDEIAVHLVTCADDTYPEKQQLT